MPYRPHPPESFRREAHVRVVTWNVLHRIHAENWSEGSVAAFPDEATRVDGITGVVTSWLEVELANGVTVLNTHVSVGHKRDAQLAKLSQLMTVRSLAMGDFNERRDVVHAALGTALTCTDLHGQRATRFGRSANDGQHIDHVLCRGGVLREATVLDTGQLSDHRPVRARGDFE